MKIGYIRVSTEEQNTARQESNLDNLVDKVFLDKLSGKNTARPQLQAMLAFVREGDTLYVDSYSRLARSTTDLLNIVEQLTNKGVQFVSLKENIDTTTPSGRLMLTIFAGLAQFERETILERQREGIAVAKAEGKYKGRKPIAVDPKAFEAVYKDWKADKMTAVQAQKKLGLTASTFYRKIREFETNT